MPNPKLTGRDALIDLWAARMVAAESTISVLRERLSWFEAAMPELAAPPAADPKPAAHLTRVK